MIRGPPRSTLFPYPTRLHLLHVGQHLAVHLVLGRDEHHRHVLVDEGYPAAEMKHGPIALIDEHMPVVFVAPKDEVYGKVLSNMQEAKARRGRLIAITT